MQLELLFATLYTIVFYLAALGLAFLFSWLSYWVFRKLQARLQARRGPPLYQPIADLIKLFGKERFVPALANKTLYILAPFIALATILLLVYIIPPGMIGWPGSLSWDLIVILSLSLMFTFSFVIAGWVSASPWGKIGASREVSVMLSVELPLALTMLLPALALNRWGAPLSLSINTVLTAQTGQYIFPLFPVLILPNWFIFYFPLAATSLFICLLTKAWMRPFGDIPEAEAEIFEGPLTEYGGPLLGVFEFARLFRFYVFAGLFVNLYLGGGDGLFFPLNIVVFLLKCLLIVIVMTIIHTASARYRIDHVFKWFFIVCVGLALFDLLRLMILGG
jgi:NADH-quinone oxidoreductase subunit H